MQLFVVSVMGCAAGWENEVMGIKGKTVTKEKG